MAEVCCAYCHEPTPPERQAPGAGVWHWPGRGEVTNCLQCAGYEQCPTCGEMFDNSEKLNVCATCWQQALYAAEIKGDPYPEEELDDNEDDGTMPDSLNALREAVIGHRIVSIENGVEVPGRWYGTEVATVITLDNGQQVKMIGNGDCCAYTELEAFLLHPDKVDHMIMGVGTTEGYTKWHIYADAGDVLELTVGWSCGNPFYYGYGFTITVDDGLGGQ